MTRPTSWLTGWRLPLRLARRDALRARGRSLLVIAMIALPVFAVTMAVVMLRTSDVSTTESLDRTLGSAQALVKVDTALPTAVVQDAEGSLSNPVDPGTAVPPLTAETLASALDGSAVVPFDQSETAFETEDGVARTGIYQGDLTDPLTSGILDLVSGRLPRSADEVVVNQALLDEGYAVGDPLRLTEDDSRPTIVGVAESTTVRTFPTAAGPAGSLPVADQTTRSFLVGGEPVSWETVEQLNALGGVVVSRSVVLDPPPDSEIAPELQSYSSGLDSTTFTVLALVVTMALLEVVLLAGPAFAVGARRLQRTLALMAAAGGTPVQARRVVISGAVVLGAVSAVVGILVGIGLAAAILPILQGFSASYFGPFEVPLLPVLGVAGFGLLSAVLAAVVPAWIASRQDVVAVLAGRRGDAAPSYRSPLAGVLLLGMGVAAAVVGAGQTGGELLIAGAALLSVLGMILLVPVVVAAVARLSGRLPLSLRYAARDAARHRTRTVPAVAAVAATVAGVVALLIANTSDGAENEATYTPMFTRGVGVLYLYGEAPPEQLSTAEAIVKREMPGATLTPVQGVPDNNIFGTESYTFTSLSRPGEELPLLSGYGTSYGSAFLVADADLPKGLVGLSGGDRAAAREALAAGGLVAFTDADPDGAPSQESIVITSETSDGGTGEVVERRSTTLEATVVHVSASGGGPAAVLSPGLLPDLGLPVATTGLVADGVTISEEQQEAVTEALTAAQLNAGFEVERGYQADDETLILQLILIGLGGVLMLGGTLTATFLALSDARPDLATLAAVGASPRRRRSVAAGYALVVGLVGALLGAAVGFVPGIAVAYPLTSTPGDVAVVEGSGYASTTGIDSGPFIDVPWLMVLGLVVVLPLLTAAIVALTARSRLPLVSRPD